MRGGRSQGVDQATHQIQFAIAYDHVAFGQLHLAFARGFDFPSFQHHARLKFLFKEIVKSCLFVFGNAGLGVRFFGHAK